MSEIIDTIKNKFGDKIIESVADDWYRVYIRVAPEDVLEVANFIHDDMEFNHANFCMGTDLDETIEVAWYVGHTEKREIIVLKSHLNREKPEVTSLTHLWNGMDWHERETFEMLGIIFKGHGDLRRLILPDVWDGFPLRNDYVYVKPSYRKPEDELIN